jgi:hypothetical protein
MRVWFYPGFWDFVVDTYSLNTVYSLGGLTVDDSVCLLCCRNSVQYIFYEGPDVF